VTHVLARHFAMHLVEVVASPWIADRLW